MPRSDWEHLFAEHLFALTNDAFGASEAITRRLAHLEILEYFESLVKAREKRPEHDLVSALVTAEVGGRKLTPDELILNCDNLIVGGTENTRIAAAGGMLAFIRHLAEWRAVADEPPLLTSAVEEVLRWTSTATHIMRTAIRAVGASRP